MMSPRKWYILLLKRKDAYFFNKELCDRNATSWKCDVAMVNILNWKQIVSGNDGGLTSQVYFFLATQGYSSVFWYSFHFYSMAVSSYTKGPCSLVGWLQRWQETLVLLGCVHLKLQGSFNYSLTWSSIMRVVKGYRIIDIPVGIGSVLHPLYIKEHNNPQGHQSSELTVGRKLDSHIPDICFCMP